MAASVCETGATESSTRSLTTRFLHGAFWSLAGAAVARGMTLAASIVAARLLGTTGFGELSMIQSTQGFFGILAGAGLGLAATKYVAELVALDRDRAGKCVRMALMIALAASLVAAVAMCFCSSWAAAAVLQRPDLALALQIGTGLIVFGAVNGVQTGAVAGLGDFRTVAFLGIVRGAVQSTAMILGIAAGGLLGGIIALVASEGLAVLANQWALSKALPACRLNSLAAAGWSGGWREFKLLWRFSLFAVLASLATTLAFWFSNLVLATQPDGYAALGVFNAAERWRQLLLFLPASVSPLILSMLSHLHGKNDFAGRRHLLGLNLWLSLITVLIPAVALMCFAPLAMSVFGAEFEQGSLTLILLAASAITVVLNTLLGQILVSKGAIGWRFGMDLLLAGVLALGSWLLIPAQHDAGLALANLLAYSVAAASLVAPVVWSLKKPDARMEAGQA
jgi:O-antigen/teichoic acid export membrane protein